MIIYDCWFVSVHIHFSALFCVCSWYGWWHMCPLCSLIWIWVLVPPWVLLCWLLSSELNGWSLSLPLIFRQCFSLLSSAPFSYCIMSDLIAWLLSVSQAQLLTAGTPPWHWAVSRYGDTQGGEIYMDIYPFSRQDCTGMLNCAPFLMICIIISYVYLNSITTVTPGQF